MLYFIIILFAVLSDQIAKYLAVAHLKTAGSIKLIPGLLNLSYVENKGAAFGMLQNGRALFLVLTAAVLLLLLVYTLKTKPENILYKLSVSMVAGGATGNFIDRALRGFVVDMLEFSFIDFPVFNIADVFIVCGSILFCVYIIFFEAKEGEKNE